jgi:hypothetical protein
MVAADEIGLAVEVLTCNMRRICIGQFCAGYIRQLFIQFGLTVTVAPYFTLGRTIADLMLAAICLEPKTGSIPADEVALSTPCQLTLINGLNDGTLPLVWFFGMFRFTVLFGVDFPVLLTLELPHGVTPAGR